MSTKSKAKSSKVREKKQLIVEEREKQWYIPPSGGIPTYKAENDPNCPVGRIGNYNRKQKQKIQSIPDTHKTAEWIKQKLDRKYEDMPLKVHVNLSKKALDEASRSGFDNSVTRPSPAEVEILQKIIVRERLIGELTRLLRSGSEILSIMGEVVELIKAIRFETVDIVEDICAWQSFQPTPRPFLYKGMNYLIKISCDFDFLDNYDEVVERFCFEFKSNPFAYKGGGNVITGAGPKNNERYLQGLLNSYYEGGNITVDGIEVVRLHNAEKIIQGEFNRLAEQGNINLGMSQSKIPDALQLMNSSIDIGGQEQTTGEASLLKQSASNPTFSASSTSNTGNRPRPVSSGGTRKIGSIFNQKKLKLERIATLQSEVDELMAVMAHITEKIRTLTADYQDRIKMFRAIESKMIDARNSGKEAAVQHCTAELVVRKAALVEISNKVKELQREHYFVGLEKKRKQGVIRTLQTELDEEKRKASLKKKIEEVIKTKGLAAALDLINMQKEDQQQMLNKTSTSGKMINAATTQKSQTTHSKSTKVKKSKKKQLKGVGKDRYDMSQNEEEDEDVVQNGNSDFQENDSFGDYPGSGGINFGETFSSQQMQQMQGLNVERIEEGDENDENEEDEDEEEGDDEDEEEDDGDDDDGDEDDDQEKDQAYSFQPPGIDGADDFLSEKQIQEQSIEMTPSPQVDQYHSKKNSTAKHSREDQLSRKHEEERAYLQLLQQELSSSNSRNLGTESSFDQNAGDLSARSQISHQSKQPQDSHSNRVGYISDEDHDDDGAEEEEEGEEDHDHDDLEVSADISIAPVGSGFQVAKAMKSSPRL